MHRTTATIVYYCSAVIVVYLIVIFFFDSAESLNSKQAELRRHLTEKPLVAYKQNTTVVSNNLTTISNPFPPCSQMEWTALRHFVPFKIFENFFYCIYPMWSQFQNLPDQMLANWAPSFYVCDQEDIIVDIPLMPYPTKNKTYWGIAPQCQDQNVLVTLGIRDDSLAVQKIKKTFGNLMTFGTSAVGWRNPDYDNFYNYAIGVNGTGIQTVYDENGKIVELQERSVRSFFNELIRVRRIDMLWVNLEGGEFEYWKYFGKTGIFSTMGITVCQMNLEFNKNDGVHFETFMRDLYESKRYIFMRPTVTQEERITRGFFLNVVDPICVRKYLK